MSESTPAGDATQLTFKVKAAGDKNHNITIEDSKSVLDLKNVLGGKDYEDVPASRLRLIYSGKVLKDADPLSKYNIKQGNTVHMVKSAAPAAPASSASQVPTAIPMAAGTPVNPLSGLTGARYAGQVSLPDRSVFGADGGMGAPPSNDQMADMLSDPATAQMLNEALSNPDVINMMIESNPMLRAMGPQAREMLQSPFFRRMMTDPEMLRQASRMRESGAMPGLGTAGMPEMDEASMQRLMQSMGGGAGGNPFGLFGAPGAAATPGTPATPQNTATNPGQADTAANTGNTGAAAQGNPFAAMFGAGGSPFGNIPPPTPEQMQQSAEMIRRLMGGDNNIDGLNLPPMFGGAAAPVAPAPPADTRPPEEVYATQLRALNDMGFFDFEANVRCLRRAGGSVEGAVEQLLR